MEIKLDVDTKKVEAALQKLNGGLSGGPLPAPLKIAFARAGVVYMAWARARFVRASRGDGTWLPLAFATKLARLRKNKTVWRRFLKTKRDLASKGQDATHRNALVQTELQGSSFEILRDTGTLLNSISVGGPGSVQDLTDHGIRLGTRVYYGAYHQHPTIPGHPPQRIIVPLPDAITERAMTDEVSRGVEQLIKDAGLAPQ